MLEYVQLANIFLAAVIIPVAKKIFDIEKRLIKLETIISLFLSTSNPGVEENPKKKK